jgi:hypothetical protein
MGTIEGGRQCRDLTKKEQKKNKKEKLNSGFP